VVFDAAAAVKVATAVTSEWSDTCGAPFELTFQSKPAIKTINVLIRGVGEMKLAHVFEAHEARCVGNISVEFITLDFANKAIEMAFSTPTKTGDDEKKALVVSHRPPTPTPETSVPLVNIGKKRKAEENDTPEWIQRLMTRVEREDEESMHTVISSIQTWDDGTFGCDFRAKVRPLPSVYEIVVSGVREVLVSAIPKIQGSIDIENKTIVLIVKRSKPLV
jgi:hypothetical protein